MMLEIFIRYRSIRVRTIDIIRHRNRLEGGFGAFCIKHTSRSTTVPRGRRARHTYGAENKVNENRRGLHLAGNLGGERRQWLDLRSTE